MIPVINTDVDAVLAGIDAQEKADVTLGMVYKYNFQTGDFVLMDGKPVLCSDEEAVKQWAEMCIRVSFGKHAVYDGTDFGCSVVERLIGMKSLPPDYVNSVVYADLSEKLLQHKLITGIQDFSITNSNGIAVITFTLLTTLGEVKGTVTVDVI